MRLLEGGSVSKLINLPQSEKHYLLLLALRRFCLLFLISSSIQAPKHMRVLAFSKDVWGSFEHVWIRLCLSYTAGRLHLGYLFDLHVRVWNTSAGTYLLENVFYSKQRAVFANTRPRVQTKKEISAASSKYLTVSSSTTFVFYKNEFDRMPYCWYCQ